MLKGLTTFLSATVLMLGQTICKKDLDTPKGEGYFEYSYVCIDNRLFLQAYKVGLTQVDNMKCECVKENKTYKNILGFEVNDSVYVIKIK